MNDLSFVDFRIQKAITLQTCRHDRKRRAIDQRLVCLCLCFGCVGLGGCRLEGAPSYSLFGAFFPAWLLCCVLGLVAAFLFRGIVIATGLEEAMPLRLLVYTSFGAALALWLWLALFGER